MKPNSGYNGKTDNPLILWESQQHQKDADMCEKRGETKTILVETK